MKNRIAETNTSEFRLNADSSCGQQVYCVLQVGHQGPCSPTFTSETSAECMADGAMVEAQADAVVAEAL